MERVVALMGNVRFRLIAAVFAALCLAITSGGIAAAQTNADVADEVDATGRFVQFDVDTNLEAAIQRANAANIGFIWIDQSGGDAELVATGVRSALAERNSRYVTVVALNNDGVWVDSRDGARAAQAAGDAFDDFLAGDVAGGLDTVTSVMAGSTAAGTDDAVGDTATATTVAGSESGTAAPAATDDGGGFPWLWLLILGGLGFLAFRFFNGRRRTTKAAVADMERDRLEIREQLRDNADRVIDLGDRAIAHGDPELIRLYEDASQAYQDVSLSIDGASTAEEIDKLDEKIDDAEWKFEVIEARIEGRPEPESPADLEPPPPLGTPAPPSAGQQPGRPSGGTVTRRGRTIPPLGSSDDRPALGRDESIFDEQRNGGRSSRTQRTQRTQRRSGGGLGGMLSGGAGRMLMSVLMSVLLGGMRGRGGSQRTQRRSGGGFGGSRGGGVGGGLGGGVLRNR